MRAAMFVLVVGLVLPSVGTAADDPPEGWQFIGVTRPSAAADVRARVTGDLTRVAVREGDKVAKGDLLAEIDPREYQLDLDKTRALLRVAEAQLQAVKLKTDNTRSLMDKKVVSRDELALQMAAQAEAEAALLVAKVDVDRAALALSWTRVVAPFNGRVSHLQCTEGDLVAAGQTHILRVVATDPLYVTFEVPEAILLRLRSDGPPEPGGFGVAVGFANDEGFPRPAKLDLIEPEVDPDTGTVQFRATIPNPDGLLSAGMSARVRLTPPPR